MRQVFTSPRLANVEAVAKLLEDAGIATKISNGRSYRGKFDRGVSYRDTGNETHAAVWVMRSEDQPRAREMLREAGLLDSTRPDQQRDSFLPEHLRVGGPQDVAAARWLSPGRLKVALLIAIALVMALVAVWQRYPGASRQAATATAADGATRGMPAAPDVLTARNANPVVQRVDVPSALATLLVVRAAGERGITETCLEVDDAAPLPRVVELLAGTGGAPVPADAPQCGEGSRLPRIRIDDYRTDGSGIGTVRMRVQQGSVQVDQRFEVERDGHDWRVTGSSRR